MSTRQIGVTVAAAIYSTLHSLIMAGEIARKVGWTDLPDPMPRILELCFLGSLAIIAGFIVPKLLRLNIAISNAILAGLDRCAKRAHKLLDTVRWAMISAAEGLASRLREQDSGSSARTTQSGAKARASQRARS